jgi:hypothetical protein
VTEVGSTIRPPSAGARMHRFFRVCSHAIRIAGGPPDFESKTAATRPTETLQALPKRQHAGLPFRSVCDSHKHPDQPHAIGLLRTRGERPRNRRNAAEPCHKRSPSYHEQIPTRGISETPRSSAMEINISPEGGAGGSVARCWVAKSSTQPPATGPTPPFTKSTSASAALTRRQPTIGTTVWRGGVDGLAA